MGHKGLLVMHKSEVVAWALTASVSVRDNFPFFSKKRNAVNTDKKRCLKRCYLPHQQASHDEGIKDGEEAINRRWLKAGQERRKMGQLIQKNLS